MTKATITPAQAATLRGARDMTDADRKAIKAQVFADVRSKFGIPSDFKLKVEIDNTSSPMFRVVASKVTGRPVYLGTNGLFDPSLNQTSDEAPQPEPATRGRVYSISAYDLLDVLRDNTDDDRVSNDGTLPDDVNFALDVETGVVYFRAD